MSHKMLKAGLDCFVKPPKEGKLDPQRTAYVCLAFVRMIVMRAYGISWNEFYTKVVDQRVSRNADGLPTYWIARDAERAMRAKWAVSPNAYQPGDIIFNYNAFDNPKYGIKEGHVGVYLGPQLFVENGVWVTKNVVIENASPGWRKTIANKGNILLSDFDHWPAVTTYVRLPDSKVELLS